VNFPACNRIASSVVYLPFMRWDRVLPCAGPRSSRLP